MISALILAAGESKRMGQPKMLLPWGELTVIEHVVGTFLQAGIEDILVVTGGASERVKRAIERLPVRILFNRNYATGEMLSSLQAGLREMPEGTQATLIGLGDQPQVQEESVRAICDRYWQTQNGLVVPSFRMKRGHPWLVRRPLWEEILALKPPESPRDFLNNHASEILYLNMDTPTVLADLDTPEDYRTYHP
jgi:molybdenum cofactor cytidylyltransferase